MSMAVSMIVSSIVAIIMSITVAGTVEITMSVALVHLGMMGVSQFLDDSIEAIVIISCVLHDTCGTISLLQRVAAVNLVAIPGFPLALLIARVRILDTVVEVILGIMACLVFVMSMAVAGITQSQSNVIISISTMTISSITMINVTKSMSMSMSMYIDLVRWFLVLGQHTVAGRMSIVSCCI